MVLNGRGDWMECQSLGVNWCCLEKIVVGESTHSKTEAAGWGSNND